MNFWKNYKHRKQQEAEARAAKKQEQDEKTKEQLRECIAAFEAAGFKKIDRCAGLNDQMWTWVLAPNGDVYRIQVNAKGGAQVMKV
jgi:hypothetical protein